MGKVITSPIKRWPGEVVISDPLTYPQVIAIEKTSKHADELKQAKADPTEINAAWLPGICACVDEWRLEGLGQLTPETFPAAPKIPALRLLAWLIDEVFTLYGEDDPNE